MLRFVFLVILIYITDDCIAQCIEGFRYISFGTAKGIQFSACIQNVKQGESVMLGQRISFTVKNLSQDKLEVKFTAVFELTCGNIIRREKSPMAIINPGKMVQGQGVIDGETMEEWIEKEECDIKGERIKTVKIEDIRVTNISDEERKAAQRKAAEEQRAKQREDEEKAEQEKRLINERKEQERQKAASEEAAKKEAKEEQDRLLRQQADANYQKAMDDLARIKEERDRKIQSNQEFINSEVGQAIVENVLNSTFTNDPTQEDWMLISGGIINNPILFPFKVDSISGQYKNVSPHFDVIFLGKNKFSFIISLGWLNHKNTDIQFTRFDENAQREYRISGTLTRFSMLYGSFKVGRTLSSSTGGFHFLPEIGILYSDINNADFKYSGEISPVSLEKREATTSLFYASGGLKILKFFGNFGVNFSAQYNQLLSSKKSYSDVVPLQSTVFVGLGVSYSLF